MYRSAYFQIALRYKLYQGTLYGFHILKSLAALTFRQFILFDSIFLHTTLKTTHELQLVPVQTADFTQ